jgi:hypothetical protein
VLGLLNQLERTRQERGEIPPGSDEAESANTSGPADGMAGEADDVAESGRDDGPDAP